MDRLKGKIILIGKEPQNGRLLIAIQGNGKSAALGTPKSVPACVSRCKPAEGIAHAKIAVDQSGNMIISNMKPQNVTYVEGSEIVSKKVTPTSRVELGKDRYGIDLPAVLNAAKTIVSANTPKPTPTPQPFPEPQKVFNISHLEHVWNDYHDSLLEIRGRQRKINIMRAGFSLFTLCAMPTVVIIGPIGYVFTGIGIIGAVYSFVGMKNDNSYIESDQLTEQFQDRYACPNPDCNKFLGNLSYRLLKKQYSMQCPYCKSKFVEK